MLTTFNYQEKSVNKLLTMLVNNTLPHALLFSGIEGTGKERVASHLAMVLNCRNNANFSSISDISSKTFDSLACGKCSSCLKIQSAIHQDVLLVSPIGKLIKISQIRELCRTIQLKPLEATTRLVIIQSANKMNQEASNALLKELEEPPESTKFILLTDQAADLLPTIVSRCRQIGFNPVSSKHIALYIQNEFALPPAKADLISFLAQGSPMKASNYASNPRLLAERIWLIGEFNKIKTLSIKDSLLFAEKLSQKKDYLTELLELLLVYVRDLIVVRYRPDKIINLDFKHEIHKTAKRFIPESLLTIADQIQSTLKVINTNASLRLTLEELVLKMARV